MAKRNKVNPLRRFNLIQSITGVIYMYSVTSYDRLIDKLINAMHLLETDVMVTPKGLQALSYFVETKDTWLPKFLEKYIKIKKDRENLTYRKVALDAISIELLTAILNNLWNEHSKAVQEQLVKEKKYFSMLATEDITRIYKSVMNNLNSQYNEYFSNFIELSSIILLDWDKIYNHISTDDLNSLIDYVEDYLTNRDIYLSRENEQDLSDEDALDILSSNSIPTDSIPYIDSYKELNKLANVNGYNYIRSNGGHGIFKNSSGRIVIIPQGRDIGKGLSIKIQKAILS